MFNSKKNIKFDFLKNSNLKFNNMKTTNKRKTAKASSRKTATASSRRGVSSPKRTNRRSNSIVSLENGINVLKTAIKKGISLSKAATEHHKLGRNYVSDIKARLEDNYKSKNITKELYTTFKSLNKEYEKTVR